MSSIGSSPGIGTGQTLKIAAMRAVGSSDRSSVPQPPVQIATPAHSISALDAGTVPVDQTRVATIRKAIETQTYPLNPARIGDAMIAAGLLLRMPR